MFINLFYARTLIQIFAYEKFRNFAMMEEPHFVEFISFLFILNFYPIDIVRCQVHTILSIGFSLFLCMCWEYFLFCVSISSQLP